MKNRLQLLFIGVAIIVAFLLGRSISADAQEKAEPRVTWEYMDGANFTAEQLNTLGAEGWELCVLTTYSRDLYFILKRPK